MARLIPDAWSSTSAYSIGTLAYYSGSVYEAVKAVAADPDGNPIPVGNTNWRFNSLIRIEDYYSLQNAVELALNVDDKVINDSIPMFIQTAEQGLNKILRSPAQKNVRTFAVDDKSRFKIPGDTLEVINMRKKDADAGFTLRSRGSVVIEAATDNSQYEAVRQNEDNDFRRVPGAGQIEYPVYWDDSSYYNIAPAYEDGTDIEFVYYQQVPPLGDYTLRVNADYEPLNEDDQTLEEWVADGNSPNTFVQAEDLTLRNLWTVSIPHLLKLGALVAAEPYLKDNPMIAIWKSDYKQNLQETVLEFEAYESRRQHSQVMTSGYFR